MKKPVQFGKYLLLDRINVGGMAEVFKAKAFGVEGFERLVAVKRILPNIAEDEEFITMFIDEAKIAVQLSHANIAQIFDLGKADDAFFIALEFVQGKDLRSIFDRCKQKPVDGSTAMPLAQACFIIMKACEGLDYAHNKKDANGEELQLVHRDVSPQNILISYEGEVKLIDFGIAKAAGKASKTQQGILKGKFGYMSPEQVRGLPLDRRSDIFAVGIVLYELLTAERLFVGESDFSTLEKVRNVEILPPSTYNRRIPEELERIVLKALAKDVEDRYQNAIDLHDDLQAFMYTAGEFYARKDLGAWMKRVYDEDIRAEQAKIESYQRLPAVVPPPSPRRSGQVPAVAPPPPPSQGGAPVRSSPQHPTLAVGAAAGEPGARPPQLTTPEAPSARNGKHANGENGAHANGARAAGRNESGRPELGWDDEELATNIYDDESEDAADSVVAELPVAARPDLSGVELSMDGSPVPASMRAPTPSRGMPQAMPTRINPAPRGGDPRSRGGGGPSNLVLIGTGAAILVVLLGIGLKLHLNGRPGQIQITSEPSGAVQLLIDNQRVPVDGTPATIDRAPGSYSLTVQREGYVPYTEQIEVKPRELLRRHVVLDPLNSGTGFRLSEPIGAQVYLDDKLLDQQTPLQVQAVRPGKHKVEVRGAVGSWVENITLETGKMTDLHPVFPNAPATTSPPSNVVSPRAPAPSLPALREPAPRAPVAVEPARSKPPVAAPPPREPVTREVTVREARPPRPPKVKSPAAEENDGVSPATSRAVEPKGERPAAGGEGYLRIGSKPWTNITIDGKDTGQRTPQTHIKLSAGSHRILLSNPQFNVRETFTVEIAAGGTETVIKDLRPKDSQGGDGD